MKEVYVIIPVYNEAAVVDKVVRDVLQQFDKVICVDDGSQDDSAAILAKTKATVIRHPFNLGAGAATQTGIEYALQDPATRYVVTFDADGQHDIKDIKPMLAYLKRHKLDVVFGSRFKGEVKNISPLKALFLRVAQRFNRLTTSVELSDPHIGLRVFNRRFANSLDITLSGFAHASELVEYIKSGRFAYGEVPVTVTYSDYSKRKGQPMINSINIVFDLLLNKVAKK